MKTGKKQTLRSSFQCLDNSIDEKLANKQEKGTILKFQILDLLNQTVDRSKVFK